MMRFWIVFTILLARTVCGADRYVSLLGDPDNPGTIARPWDIGTALSSALPGDTVWFRGGVYSGQFTCTASGVPGRPIVFRAYPRERPRIDGGSSQTATLTVWCHDVWFQGLEIYSSDPKRVTDQPDSVPTDILRGAGAITNQVSGPDAPVNVKFINMVIHDTAGAIGAWKDALNTEIYGNIIYFDGWDGPDRGHGHGIYVQNTDNGTKHIEDNILFCAFSHGLHAFSLSDLLLDLHVEGNVAFRNGVLSAVTETATNFRVSGSDSPRNILFKDNFAYYGPGDIGGNNVLGSDSGCSAMTVTGNYFLSQKGFALVKPPACTDAVITDNTFFGDLSGFSPSQFPKNTYLNARPAGSAVFVRPNRYESGRAHIIVLNWDLLAAVTADLSAVLKRGDRFEIHDVQNLFGTPVVAGVYDGAPVRLPLSGREMSKPVGNVPVRPVHTGSEFNVFLVTIAPSVVRPASPCAGIERSPGR